MNTQTTIAGVTFKNPVMTASGTFGSGMEYEEFVDLNRLGAVVTKGVANVPWPGNPTPRVAEVYGGMINAIGLQHPGELKNHAKQPIIMKLSPNVTDITEMAKAAEAAGADALSLINTITGMKIDIHRRKFAIANKTGGMSGPAIKPIAVRMVYQVAQAVQIPIIGMGGIATAEDAIEFILAGASAVSVGAMNFVDPYTTVKVVEGIEDYMRTYHVENLTDLIGAVQ